jgi:hypothetical protein
MVERGMQAYIRTIIQFHTIKRLSIGGVRDMTAQFARVDQERRNAHEGLLDSLRTMRQAVLAAAGTELIPKQNVIEWTMGMNAGELLSHNPHAVIVFSDRVLQDRNYIRDWAIAADFEERLKEMTARTHTA